MDDTRNSQKKNKKKGKKEKESSLPMSTISFPMDD